MLTPFGVLGGLAGVFFAGIGPPFQRQSFKPWSSNNQEYKPIINYQQDVLGNVNPVYGRTSSFSGFRLKDARASYGIASKRRCWASRCTSTGRGGRSSTPVGRRDLRLSGQQRGLRVGQQLVPRAEVQLLDRL